jgi:hypothetical protein
MLIRMLGNLYRLLDGLYVYPGLPFLYVEDLDALVLSDLHLGFEEAAARGLEYSLRGRSGYAGVFLPRIQFKRAVEMLGKAFRLHKPRRVIVNGDLKHAFDRLLKQEKEEVARLIDFIRSNDIYEITVVRGNHDNFLRRILDEYGVLLVTSIEVSRSRLLITHGHLDVDPSSYETVLIGHEHPSVRCFAGKTPAFLLIPLSTGGRLVVQPATGPYHPGTTFTLDKENYLSPLVKKYGVLEEASFVFWVESELGGKTPGAYTLGEEVIQIREFRMEGVVTSMIRIGNPLVLQALCEV